MRFGTSIKVGLLATGLWATAAVPAGAPAPDSQRPRRGPAAGARLPATLVDIDGNTLDLAEIAGDDNLVIITLKATWCQVCQHQLVRIRERLPELERCDATFIVLAPGPAEELRAIREATGFEFPFVEDVGLEIAQSLGLVMAPGQIFPCMFEVKPDVRVGWRQLGRSGWYFGDGELSAFFDCLSI